MKARIAVTVAATIGCVGLIAGATYAVTVLEWVMPASNLQLGYAAALDYSIKTADLSALDAQAKASHGAEAEAIYDSENGAGIRVGGSIVERPPMVRKITSIYGLFTVSD